MRGQEVTSFYFIRKYIFTKRTKLEKNEICLSFAISGLSFIIYFIAVFEQRLMQKTSAHKPVFYGGWHGRTPESRDIYTLL